MWPLLREYVHESIVVSLDDAAKAMRLVAERSRVIAEGAAACAVAAAVSPAMAAARTQEDRRRRVRRQRRSQEICAARRCMHVNIPDRIKRLPELATDLWWTWNPQARDVFRRLDYPLWRQTAHNPVLMLRNVSAELLERVGARRSLRRDLRRRHRRARRARAARDTWWQTALQRQPGPHRLLLRRVRAAPVAADLRRRPRRAGRRSLQGSQRPRRPAHRRRVHVSAGLLPPERLARRLAAGILRAPELGQRADRAGDDARRRARASSRCRSATAPCWCRCGACGSGA